MKKTRSFLPATESGSQRGCVFRHRRVRVLRQVTRAQPSPEVHERIQIDPTGDPAADMARAAAKRALEKRAAGSGSDSGSGSSLPR